MFDTDSRYASLDILTHTGPDGRAFPYVARRFLPKTAPGNVIREHLVTEAERTDYIAARYLGNPELFWQLADVNNAMRPEEMTEEVGRRLVVALLPEVPS